MLLSSSWLQKRTCTPRPPSRGKIFFVKAGRKALSFHYCSIFCVFSDDDRIPASACLGFFSCVFWGRGKFPGCLLDFRWMAHWNGPELCQGVTTKSFPKPVGSRSPIASLSLNMWKCESYRFSILKPDVLASFQQNKVPWWISMSNSVQNKKTL